MSPGVSEVIAMAQQKPSECVKASTCGKEFLGVKSKVPFSCKYSCLVSLRLSE